MDNERPITAEQAMVAVKAAGLDLDKPLSEQLNAGPNDALERKIADLTQQVRTLADTLGVHGQGGQPSEPQSPEGTFAEGYRDALNRSLTPWMGEEHNDAA
jgi:hypothetical protein